MSPDFAGKIAAVTGAGAGLGRATALALAKAGCAGLVLMDIDEAALEETVAALPSGTAFLCRRVDVTKGVELKAVAAEAADRFGSLQVLATAAGMLGPVKPIVECDEAEWDALFALNVRGTFLTVKHFLPLLRAAGGGTAGGGAIVLFASSAGLQGSAILGPYSASKGAVVMMTRSLALTHAAEGIRVNCVCPGSIESPMFERNLAAAGSPETLAERRDAYRLKHPLQRFGTPEEVAAAVLYLASDAAGFTTGVALPVDGGRLA